jgi:hypothetical protein
VNRDVGSAVVFEANKREGIVVAVVVADPMLIPKFAPERYDTFTEVEDMLLLTSSSSDENVDVDMMDLAVKEAVESSSMSTEEEEGGDEDEDMIVLVVTGCVSDAVNIWFDCALEEDVTVPP